MYKLFEEVEVSAKDLKGDWRHLWHYILETEVHVYAFAIGGNVLLSLWPFLMVMISLCRNVFHWSAAEEAIYVAVKDYFAGTTGEFLVFDQREFVRDLAGHGLDDSGMVYVPRACRASQGCRVHVVFHGCNQQRAKAGDAFIRDTGYANWADTNRLIVLFPQVSAGTLNPQGCWDWWGYSGADYAARSGAQISAVHRMLIALGAS